MSWFGTASYAVCALAYGVVAVILLLGRPQGRPTRWCVAAVAVTTVWAVAVLLAADRDGMAVGLVASIDAVHSLIWTIAALAFLTRPEGAPGNQLSRRLGGASLLLCVVVIASSTVDLGHTGYLALVLMAAIGLLAVEQVYRNAQQDQRRSLTLLCTAIGALFALNLFVYSHAVLLGGLLQILWESRGVLVAAVSPLFVLGLRLQPEWEQGPYVSRHVVFYTATLLAVGAYLVAMALIAYPLRAIGGEWSVLLELIFLIAAGLVLAVVLFSRNLRARFRVFLVKNFFRSKYDYRSEWLRLTDLLARGRDTKTLARAGLEGIARIVGSTRGNLWMTRDGRHYDWLMSMPDTERDDVRFDAEHPMVSFLASRGWVIDSEQYARAPDHYDNAFGAPDSGLLPAKALIVPLDCRGSLQGFVVLEKSSAVGDLNFDDHDILKTAGKQFAAFFAQALAQEQLSETRQFEAMNKLSTFLMHDLKNLIAQQELVVKNAQRFGHRPEFFRDAIETVRSGVERMKKVVGQLRSGSLRSRVTSRADASKVLIEVRSACSDRLPVPSLINCDFAVWVRMDRDSLSSVFTHLIRNAQDATPPEGRIDVALETTASEASILVADTGEGMDAAFIRDHLFRPFGSTKGADGMGIGVYQVRDLVRMAGGDVQVRSTPGRGTTFHIRLPLDVVAEQDGEQ